MINKTSRLEQIQENAALIHALKNEGSQMSKKCEKKGCYRYTWPGRDEAVCCLNHSVGIKKVSEVMGFHLQMVPLSEKDLELGLRCTSLEDSDE